MGVPTPEAIVLGVIQGITEFLPISSDGHLALAQKLYGHPADLATTVILHVGTLGATFVVLRKRIGAILEEAGRALRQPRLLLETPAGHDILVILAATVPTGVIGLALKNRVEVWSDSLAIVGACFLLSAAAVASTSWAPRRKLLAPTMWGGVIVGIAQGSAVLPGLSRSAMTIAALLWLGVRGERAFELSFLMSLPAVLGAVILESREAFHGSASVGPMAIGVGVAFVTGILALLALRRVLEAGKLWAFALYTVPLGLATLAWAYASP